MKSYPPEYDDDYEGRKGCLIMAIASLATFGLFAVVIFITYLIINLVKLI